jgi:aspartokinase
MTNESVEPPSSGYALQNQASEFLLQSSSPDCAKGSVKAIEFKKAVSVVTINSTRQLSAFVFLQKVFELFEQHGIAFDLVTVSEIAVSVVLDEVERLGPLRKDLSGMAHMKIESHKAAVCLSLAESPCKSELPCRIFQAIESVNISFITHGNGGRRLAFVINESEMEAVAFILFEQFFEKSRVLAATGN